MSIADLCRYIASKRLRRDACIMTVIRRVTLGVGVRHRYLLVKVRERWGRKHMWIRLDRRAQYESLVKFAMASSVAPAKDTANISTSETSLYGDEPSEEEARMTFGVAPTLEQLAALLRVISEESAQYKLWPDNCWFFCSIL